MNGTYNTLVPLNRLLKPFALNCIYVEKGKLISKWPKIIIIFTVILMTAVNLAIYYYKTFLFDFVNPNFFTIVHSMYLVYFISYILDLLYVKNYGQEECVKYYTRYETIDNMINLKGFTKAKKKYLKSIIVYVGLTISIAAISYFSCLVVFPDNPPSCHVYLPDNVFYLIKVLTILDAVSQMHQMKMRLSKIHYSLQNLSGVNLKFSTLLSRNRDMLEKKPFTILKTANVELSEDLQWLSKCYLMILDQNEYINNAYGMRVLIRNITLLIDCILFLNYGIRSAMDKKFNQYKYLASAASFLRLFNSAAVLVVLMDSAEKCYRQYENIIGAVDQILIFKKTDNNRARLNLKEFRKLLVTRKIQFHAANFYQLDYSALASLTSVIFTYTVIFLQSLQT